MIFRRLATAFALIFALTVAAQASAAMDRIWLRQQFENAEKNSAATRAMIADIEASGFLAKESCPSIVKAYYGALKTLAAKFDFRPTRKMTELKAGLLLLDETVVAAPDDLEIHFLRFATLHHLPGFLSDREKRSQDLMRIYTMLLERDFSVVDQATQRKMIDFLLESDRLSERQAHDLRVLATEASPS